MEEARVSYTTPEASTSNDNVTIRRQRKNVSSMSLNDLARLALTAPDEAVYRHVLQNILKDKGMYEKVFAYNDILDLVNILCLSEEDVLDLKCLPEVTKTESGEADPKEVDLIPVPLSKGLQKQLIVFLRYHYCLKHDRYDGLMEVKHWMEYTAESFNRFKLTDDAGVTLAEHSKRMHLANLPK